MQLLPIADVRAEKLTALRNIKMLALSRDVPDRVRLEASVMLLEFCEKAEAQELPKGNSLDPAGLIEAILREFRRAGEEAQEGSHEGRPLANSELEKEP
jgi:hypothetical protein